jgi:hypothetical protein
MVKVVSNLTPVVSRAKIALSVSFVVLLAALLGCSTASASKVLGAPEYQSAGSVKLNNTTLIQTQSPGDRYVAPADGVITSWSKWPSGDPTNQRLKLKVARNTPAGWRVIGESALEFFTNVFSLKPRNTFLTRIAVKGGDVIGLYGSGEQYLADKEEGYFAYGKFGYDVLAGSAEDLGPTINYVVVVDAVWEPDADVDGFGDESQDRCPGVAGPIDGCPPVVAPPPVINVDPVRGGPKKASCPKGKKKVTVKGKTKCKPKHKKHKGKAKAKGHRK